MGDLSTEVLAALPLDFSHKYFYNEPKDILDARIKLSLPAMTDFLLDETIDDFIRYSWGFNPLFLSSFDEGGWGREVWIKDIEHFKYKPAFTNLREVWLHDKDKYLANHALSALASFADDALIKDLQKKYADSQYDWHTLGSYLDALAQIDSPVSVKLMIDAADYIRSFNDATVYYFDKEKKLLKQEGVINHYPGSDLILGIMTSIGFMKNEKVESALKTLKQWFRGDVYLMRRYSQAMELQARVKEIEQKQARSIVLREEVPVYDLSKGDLFF
jgi:hypothetical protein